MRRDLTQGLAEWVEGGGERIGQIAIARVATGFELRHLEDVMATGDCAGLRTFTNAESARAIANLDDAGRFRPLKTAPNLAHGWRLVLGSVEELRQALDYFYPAMLGVYLSARHGQLAPVPLRATLGRQSGMYRVTQRITDAQADAMIGRFCRSDGGCLKAILWRITEEVPITSLPPEKFQPSTSSEEWPLLCHEACNLLVAEARKVVKS